MVSASRTDPKGFQCFRTGPDNLMKPSITVKLVFGGLESTHHLKWFLHAEKKSVFNIYHVNYMIKFSVNSYMILILQSMI